MKTKIITSAICAALFLFHSSFAIAGMVEVGASASYRTSTISASNYSNSESYTGSLGYYFSESTALELSYTNGFSKTVTDDSLTKAYFTIYGLDFILTIGAKEASFRPYLKVGAAQIYKEIRYQQTGFDPLPPIKSCGLAPSGGAGFRLLLTQNFALKAGAEAWTSPINEKCLPEEERKKLKTTYDNAYRAGISWMF